MCIYEVSGFENCFAERETKPADGLGRGRGRSVELVARPTACLCINRPKMKQAEQSVVKETELFTIHSSI